MSSFSRSNLKMMCLHVVIFSNTELYWLTHTYFYLPPAGGGGGGGGRGGGGHSGYRRGPHLGYVFRRRRGLFDSRK